MGELFVGEVERLRRRDVGGEQQPACKTLRKRMMQIAGAHETDQRGDLNELVLKSALQIRMSRHRLEEPVFRDLQRVTADDCARVSG